MPEFKKPEWSLIITGTGTKIHGLSADEIRFAYSVLSASERVGAMVWRQGMATWAKATTMFNFDVPFHPPAKLKTPKPVAKKLPATVSSSLKPAVKGKAKAPVKGVLKTSSKTPQRIPLKSTAVPKRAAPRVPAPDASEFPDFDKTVIDDDVSETTRIFQLAAGKSAPPPPIKVRFVDGKTTVSVELIGIWKADMILSRPLPMPFRGRSKVDISCSIGQFTYEVEIIDPSRIKLLTGKDLQKFSNWVTLYFS